MDWKTWALHTLQNKYVAATVLAVVWSTFIHDLGIHVWQNHETSITLNKNSLK